MSCRGSLLTDGRHMGEASRVPAVVSFSQKLGHNTTEVEFERSLYFKLWGYSNTRSTSECPSTVWCRESGIFLLNYGHFYNSQSESETSLVSSAGLNWRWNKPTNRQWFICVVWIKHNKFSNRQTIIFSWCYLQTSCSFEDTDLPKKKAARKSQTRFKNQSWVQHVLFSVLSVWMCVHVDSAFARQILRLVEPLLLIIATIYESFTRWNNEECKIPSIQSSVFTVYWSHLLLVF